MTRRRFAVKAALALVLPAFVQALPPPHSAVARVAVLSTSLASVGYDRASAVLEIEFLSGAVYRYSDVPVGVHQELMAAESKGRFFSQRIRGRFRFKRITEARP